MSAVSFNFIHSHLPKISVFKVAFKNCRLYSTNGIKSAPNLVEIRKFFERFRGGKVDFEQDFATGIAKIIFRNAERRNAFTGQMMVELADVVSELEKWTDGKGVLLHGTGTSFCSGLDLSVAAAIKKPEYGPMLTAMMHDTLQRLHRLPMVSAALVRGSAVGGGAELATACDFRLMFNDSNITFVHVRRGIVPGWGGGSFLARLVGAQRAAVILLSGEPIRAKDALRYGLATAIFESPSSDQDSAVVEGIDWLSALTKGPSVTIRAMKKLIVAASELPLSEAHVKEAQILATVWGGPQHQ